MASEQSLELRLLFKTEPENVSENIHSKLPEHATKYLNRFVIVSNVSFCIFVALTYYLAFDNNPSVIAVPVLVISCIMFATRPLIMHYVLKFKTCACVCMTIVFTVFWVSATLGFFFGTTHTYAKNHHGTGNSNAMLFFSNVGLGLGGMLEMITHYIFNPDYRLNRQIRVFIMNAANLPNLLSVAHLYGPLFTLYAVVYHTNDLPITDWIFNTFLLMFLLLQWRLAGRMSCGFENLKSFHPKLVQGLELRQIVIVCVTTWIRTRLSKIKWPAEIQFRRIVIVAIIQSIFFGISPLGSCLSRMLDNKSGNCYGKTPNHSAKLVVWYSSLCNFLAALLLSFWTIHLFVYLAVIRLRMKAVVDCICEQLIKDDVKSFIAWDRSMIEITQFLKGAFKPLYYPFAYITGFCIIAMGLLGLTVFLGYYDTYHEIWWQVFIFTFGTLIGIIYMMYNIVKMSDIVENGIKKFEKLYSIETEAKLNVEPVVIQIDNQEDHDDIYDEKEEEDSRYDQNLSNVREYNYEIDTKFWTNVNFDSNTYVIHRQFVSHWKSVNYGVNLFGVTINRSYIYSLVFLLISQPIIFGIDWLVDE